MQRGTRDRWLIDDVSRAIENRDSPRALPLIRVAYFRDFVDFSKS